MECCRAEFCSEGFCPGSMELTDDGDPLSLKRPDKVVRTVRIADDVILELHQSGVDDFNCFRTTTGLDCLTISQIKTSIQVLKSKFLVFDQWVSLFSLLTQKTESDDISVWTKFVFDSLKEDYSELVHTTELFVYLMIFPNQSLQAKIQSVFQLYSSSKTLSRMQLCDVLLTIAICVQSMHVSPLASPSKEWKSSARMAIHSAVDKLCDAIGNDDGLIECDRFCEVFEHDHQSSILMEFLDPKAWTVCETMSEVKGDESIPSHDDSSGDSITHQENQSVCDTVASNVCQQEDDVRDVNGSNPQSLASLLLSEAEMDSFICDVNSFQNSLEPEDISKLICLYCHNGWIDEKIYDSVMMAIVGSGYAAHRENFSRLYRILCSHRKMSRVVLAILCNLISKLPMEDKLSQIWAELRLGSDSIRADQVFPFVRTCAGLCSIYHQGMISLDTAEISVLINQISSETLDVDHGTLPVAISKDDFCSWCMSHTSDTVLCVLAGNDGERMQKRDTGSEIDPIEFPPWHGIVQYKSTAGLDRSRIFDSKPDSATRSRLIERNDGAQASRINIQSLSSSLIECVGDTTVASSAEVGVCEDEIPQFSVCKTDFGDELMISSKDIQRLRMIKMAGGLDRMTPQTLVRVISSYLDSSNRITKPYYMRALDDFIPRSIANPTRDDIFESLLPLFECFQSDERSYHYSSGRHLCCSLLLFSAASTESKMCYCFKLFAQDEERTCMMKHSLNDMIETLLITLFTITQCPIDMQVISTIACETICTIYEDSEKDMSINTDVITWDDFRTWLTEKRGKLAQWIFLL